MKKFSLKKILLSSVLIASIFVPSIFMVSCSAASTTQINTPVKISATNNSFLASNFTFTPGPQPVFKKNGANLDNKTDSLFFDYWANIIAPTYALSTSSVILDSSTSTSKFLSEGATIREPSFNYAVSNSWVSGSDIYVNDAYRFKLMPFNMNMTMTGEIPKIEKETALTASNVSTEVTMTNLSINFSYFNIVDGSKFDNATAILQLEKLFPKVNFKPDYKVDLNLSSRTKYEVLNQKDDTLVVPGTDTKFDPATMKVKVTNDYHISSLAGTTESNKIVISDDIVLFNDWMTNPKNIKIIYKNLITSIS